jgi:hypothetical protein
MNPNQLAEVRIWDNCVEVVTKPAGITVRVREYDTNGLENPHGVDIEGAPFVEWEHDPEDVLTEGLLPRKEDVP